MRQKRIAKEIKRIGTELNALEPGTPLVEPVGMGAFATQLIRVDSRVQKGIKWFSQCKALSEDLKKLEKRGRDITDLRSSLFALTRQVMDETMGIIPSNAPTIVQKGN